ncbi:hypothetical protein BS17DRAFT_791753 [Gyrodon lividus]|nr:hypothetical protein BS17DRAFT_791753 [Gyrodon lividus]
MTTRPKYQVLMIVGRMQTLITAWAFSVLSGQQIPFIFRILWRTGCVITPTETILVVTIIATVPSVVTGL